MTRKPLVAAIAAAVLALTPAANAATPATVLVNGSSTAGVHSADLRLMGQVDITVGALELTCSDVGGSGSVDGGSLSSPFYDDVWLRVTATTFDDCDGPGGNLMEIDQACALQVRDRSSASVGSAMTDVTSVKATIPAGCLHTEDASGGSLCSLDIVGSVNGTFDEHVKTIGGIAYQTLSVGGSGLTAASVSGCFGQVSNGTAIDFDLVLDVQLPDGPVNQVPGISPPTTVDVGGYAAAGAHDVNYLLRGPVDVTMGDLSLSCTDVGGSGAVDSGPLSTPFSTDVWARVSSAHFDDCELPYGSLADISLSCSMNITDRSTASVTSAITDVKDIAVTIPAGCLRAQDVFGGFLCKLNIQGTVNGTFDESVETVGGIDYQALAVSGSGLQAASVSGCFGQVSNGAAIGFDLAFDVQSPDGLINQKPGVAPTPTVLVGGSSAVGTHAAAFSLRDVNGITLGDLELSCTDVGGAASVDSGALSSPFSSDVWMRVTSTHFDDCDGPGGNLMDITQTCAMQVRDRSTASVTSAITDVKDVAVTIPSGCLKAQDVSGGTLCKLNIQGTVNGTFDEHVVRRAGADYQTLSIGGSGLAAASVSGCFGEVSNGTAIGLDLAFGVRVPDGPVNQVPNTSPPTVVAVGGSSVADTHTAAFALEGYVDVTMGDLSLSCSDVGGLGSVDSGALASPYYDDVWLRVTSSHYDDCDGPGGNLMDISQRCDFEVNDWQSASVTTAVTDVEPLTLTIPAGCLQAEDIFGGFLCKLDVQGSVGGTFDETATTIGGVDYQELSIGGPGLKAQNVSGCFGQVSNGTSIGFTQVYDVRVPDGLVNQIPAP